MNNKCGERIKALRKAAGMSQEELGKLLGLQKSTIGKWEKGIVKNLKGETVHMMAKHFGVSPVYIMGLDDNPQAGTRLAKLTAIAKRLTDEQLDALIVVATSMVK